LLIRKKGKIKNFLFENYLINQQEDKKLVAKNINKGKIIKEPLKKPKIFDNGIETKRT
jgi:hypothetical protein